MAPINVQLRSAWGAANYSGGTTFFTQGSASTQAVSAVIFLAANDQVPDPSPVTVTTVAGSGGSKGILNLFGELRIPGVHWPVMATSSMA